MPSQADRSDDEISPFKVLVKKPNLTLFKTFREAEKPGFSRLNTKIFRIPTEENGFRSLVTTNLVCQLGYYSRNLSRPSRINPKPNSKSCKPS
jgi:hypothetical protein